MILWVWITKNEGSQWLPGTGKLREAEQKFFIVVGTRAVEGAEYPSKALGVGGPFQTLHISIETDELAWEHICKSSSDMRMEKNLCLRLSSHKGATSQAWEHGVAEGVRWRQEINGCEELLTFNEGKRSRSLTWKWFLCVWRKYSILSGNIFHLLFLQVLSQQKASFSSCSQWCNPVHISKLTLMEDSRTNPRAGRRKLLHHESLGTACEKALSFQPCRGYQIAFNVASISAGPQDVCLLQVSWELKNLFVGNDIIPVKPYLKENILILQGSLSQLHFNLTGGSFPDVSVSTGISAHTHPHSTLATKECKVLLRWAGGGRLPGEEGFPCHSSSEISLERRGNYTKAKYVGSELLPAGGLCVSRVQPPPWSVLLPRAAKGITHVLAWGA